MYAIYAAPLTPLAPLDWQSGVEKTDKAPLEHLGPRTSQAWLSLLLPHCLAKIDRVSFGIMTTEEPQPKRRAERGEKRTGTSPRCCAVVRHVE